uniref:Uncharacterized protein n=1 Tax=Rhizophora mucronata TaxID=61149 RepID=A0A2P2PDW8_RHIMU
MLNFLKMTFILVHILKITLIINISCMRPPCTLKLTCKQKKAITK